MGLFSTHIHREGFQGIEDSDENEKENRIEVTNTAANPVPSMRYRLQSNPISNGTNHRGCQQLLRAEWLRLGPCREATGDRDCAPITRDLET